MAVQVEVEEEDPDAEADELARDTEEQGSRPRIPPYGKYTPYAHSTPYAPYSLHLPWLTTNHLLLTTYYLCLPWQAAHDAVREEKLLLARQAFGLMDTSGDGELSRSEVRYLVITPVELLQHDGILPGYHPTKASAPSASTPTRYDAHPNPTPNQLTT
eukprot:scaffold30770_cov30-Phaeocystis_antarctica.AAC.1